ncbi:putative oxidoreductase, aryl-alcohol dehydrogenase like protein [Frankia sp. EI5c]|uniref:aldo/keto reductase n=1 Tax=Frankia sp. EI5c TaxID=683316 RepID=UPI0007C3478F|nr:aldo/keto reductase [Frankia sp. EI5c]OAA18442.1 putative oxidoreductase, aryl-alcohol dehydrogenase like protein [Frankia sp. EI5c]
MTGTSLLSARTLAGGLTVHPIGVGCWAIGGPDHNLGLPMGWSTANDHASRAGLELAYTLGANLFDTADVYGHGHSERLLGQLVAQVDRDSVVLSSKVGYFAGTADHAYLPTAMRRQLETSLENLRTDRLDIYFFHTSEFGPDDRYLDDAIVQMRDFQRQGLVRCVGMRGPHRYAPHRLTQPRNNRPDKHARFRTLFDRIRPDYLAVRHNPLTPPPPAGQPDIFTLAADHHTSILINKPLGQGLLTGKYDPRRPPHFDDGDHRQRKRWYTPDALTLVDRRLAPLRERFGSTTQDLARVALTYSLQRADNAAVLVGFTTPDQVRENLTAL